MDLKESHKRTYSDMLAALRPVESAARTYSRTFDCVLERGENARVWDTQGSEYIDLLACAGALPLGHNNPHVVETVLQYFRSGQLQQALDIATPARLLFIEELLETLPSTFSSTARLQFCGPTGSDAVEAAIKLFKTVTGRRSVIAFHGGYHGMTLGSLSLMGEYLSEILGKRSIVRNALFPLSEQC